MKEQKKASVFENIYDFIEIAVYALALVAVLFAFFIRIVAVDGPSMNDTLQDKDKLVLSKFMYTPERGDIVVISRDEEGLEPLIKRVIAVEGDTVRIDPKTCIVYLNGEALDEPYVNYPTFPGDMPLEGITVPEDYVFVMGDHRDRSLDSRALGCFHEDDVIGKAVWRLYPDFGGLYDDLA